MDNRTGLVLIVNLLGVGGAEKHTIQLFNRLNSKKFRLGLVYLKKYEHLLKQVNFDQGEVWCAQFKHGWDRKGLKVLTEWLNRFEPKIIVTINEYPLFYGILASRMMRRKPKIVEIFHTGSCGLIDALKLQMLYRWFFRAADNVVYVSDFQKRYWMQRGLKGKKSIRIYNGIDTNYFVDDFSGSDKINLRKYLNLGENDLVVGICAVMRPEKNHLKILSVQKKAKDKNINFKLIMIGGGPLRKKIENKIKRLNLENDVRIVGTVNDVKPYIAICDCVIMGSRIIENFSLAVLESMSMGKPVIAADIGGVKEQIDNLENGLIYKVNDSDSLIECIKKIQNENYRKMLGMNANIKVRKYFDLSEMINQYEKLFEKIA